MVSVGMVASQYFVKLDPPSTDLMEAPSVVKSVKETFLFTKCRMIGSLS